MANQYSRLRRKASRNISGKPFVTRLFRCGTPLWKPISSLDVDATIMFTEDMLSSYLLPSENVKRAAYYYGIRLGRVFRTHKDGENFLVTRIS